MLRKISTWAVAAGWLGLVAATVGLVWLGPNERDLMGRLPPVAAKTRDHSPVMLPQELPAERTLALLVFQPEQRDEARGWIDGMGLRGNASVPWLKMRVL